MWEIDMWRRSVPKVYYPQQYAVHIVIELINHHWRSLKIRGFVNFFVAKQNEPKFQMDAMGTRRQMR